MGYRYKTVNDFVNHLVSIPTSEEYRVAYMDYSSGYSLSESAKKILEMEYVVSDGTTAKSIEEINAVESYVIETFKKNLGTGYQIRSIKDTVVLAEKGDYGFNNPCLTIIFGKHIRTKGAPIMKVLFKVFPDAGDMKLRGKVSFETVGNVDISKYAPVFSKKFVQDGNGYTSERLIRINYEGILHFIYMQASDIKECLNI